MLCKIPPSPFVNPGTLVLCKDENGNQCHKKIEEIAVGDKVLAFNEETGEQDFKKVVRLFRNETKEWLHIFVLGEEIVCTPEHPFYVVGKGFITAKNLTISDKLLLSDKTYAIILKIEVEKLEVAETTYNFEVEDYHTYYVGSGILVHNACGNATVEIIETKSSNQMKISDATNAWDDFLGVGQHNTNPLTGLSDANRIFSANSTRSIRFSPHEMRSIGTAKAHFHFETWSYNSSTNHITIYNVLQRLRM